MRRTSGVQVVAALCAAAFSGVGCQDGEDVEVVVAEANDLGVAEIEIHRTKTDMGEPVIEAIGVDARGVELGRATLLVTDVVWPPAKFGDEPPADAKPQPGSLLTLTFGDKSLVITSPDRTRQTKYVPDAMLRKFASLPAVEAAIEDAAGLTFGWKSAAQGAAEAPYTHGWWGTPSGGTAWCNAGLWPSSDGTLDNCSEEVFSSGYGGFTFFVDDIVGNKLGLRNTYFGCRRGNGDTACGMGHANGSCAYGPCGGNPNDISGYYNYLPVAYVYDAVACCYDKYSGGDSSPYWSGGIAEPFIYNSQLESPNGTWSTGKSFTSACSYSKGCGNGTGPIP